MTLHDRPITRRAIVAGAGVAAAAAAVGCSTGEASEPNKQASGAPKHVAKKAPMFGDGVPDPNGDMIATCNKIPVGSGIITADGTVVTQPREGDYYGFSGVCPHAGCAITAIIHDKITCTCHGSEFSLTGDVEKGPSRKPLNSCDIVCANEKIFKQS